MTTALSDFQRIGDRCLAVIVRQSVQAGPLPLSFVGSRQPVAVLIHGNGRTQAHRPDGGIYPLAELEANYPGLCAEFEARAVSAASR